MSQGAPAAFFSYSREDSAFALRLAADLKAAGANVWLDQLDIVPGQRWDRAVEDALSTCPRMLVILSPSSVGSTNVMDEVSFALEEQKTVIPVLYKDCMVPFRLRRVQHIDFRQDYAGGVKELLKTLTLGPGAGQDSLPMDVTSRPNEHEKNEQQHTAEQARLEEERRKAGEQARLEEEQRQAADRAQVEQEHKRAAEQARLEEEQKKAGEQARLEEERKQAAAASVSSASDSPKPPTAVGAVRSSRDVPQSGIEESDGSRRRKSALPARILMIGLVACIVAALTVYFAFRHRPVATTASASPSAGDNTSPPSTTGSGSEDLTKPAQTPPKTTDKKSDGSPSAKNTSASSTGSAGGVIGGLIEPGSAPPKINSPQRIRMAAGVAEANLIRKVEPVYPPIAKASQVQGDVKLQALIGRDGTVEGVRVISGPPMLAPAAIDAVKGWRYRPYVLNGEPVKVDTTIVVRFRIP